MSHKHISRRKFIGTGTCAAIGMTTFFSTWMDLNLANAATFAKSDVEGYKAMVCILLGGGNDSFNMLVPRGDDEYNEYANVRSNLALAQNSLIPLNFTTSNGKTLGLHPSMPELGNLFNQGKLCFVNNVGTLVEPITKTQFYNNSVPTPLGLFSHEDQQKHWQTSVPQDRTALGWGGRIADLMQTVNENDSFSMNISLDGTNLFQAGQETATYTINRDIGSYGINGYNLPNDDFSAMKSGVIDNLIDHNYQDIYKKTYANTIRYAQNTHELFSSAIDDVNIATPFSENPLSQAMRMIARTIAVRDQLSMKRQIFFVHFGGFDNHDEVLNNQMLLLSTVSAAMGEFYAATEELGIQDDVLTFTISDFARTLTSNGNGTDHGWGGNQMVMGGGINGGQIFGEYPDLGLNNSLDVGNGVLIPKISTDEYFAELCLWYGVDKSELSTILPNIGNFYNTSSDELPLGIVNL